MKCIPVGSRLAFIDDEDYEELSCWAWQYVGGYARGYDKRQTRKKLMYMHRVIMCAPVEMTVDHINHDKLDNRRSNLRLATHVQNRCNSDLRDGSTGYKGVYKAGTSFRARIIVNGTRIELGEFRTEAEAARAYNQAALSLHGEFAVLNEVE